MPDASAWSIRVEQAGATTLTVIPRDATRARALCHDDAAAGTRVIHLSRIPD